MRTLGNRSARTALTVVVGGGLLFSSLVAAPAQAKADTFDVPSSATITILGHGFGHGHGMSQYGAQGAGLQGLDHRQILDFYYPGTTWSTGGGTIQVLISADTSKDVVVSATKRLSVKSLAKKRSYPVARLRPGATAWKLRPQRANTQIRYRTDRWRTLTTFKGDAEFRAKGSPLTLRVAGTRVAYRGVLRATRGDTVNILPLDSYLKGVVPQEVPARWTTAAVQAQAVAARTYAAYERANVSSSRHFQVYDTTRSQVYGGVDAEQPESNAAVEATRKQILTYDGGPAFTQFSSSNGGWMSAGSQPYLVAKQDPYDGAGGNPNSSWSATVTDAELEKRWPQIGDLTQLDIPVRDGNGDFGGRADSVVLTGSTGSVTVSGEDFRFLVGLKSDWFTFSSIL
ncbi:MAG: SpoIID/LytB domain-containing protein [Nocardioides sp.]|nr:SpoIID/LytB domain-containing protein [Nocardioides sp.]